MEIWKSVVGFEGWYEVSSEGRVKRIRPGRATRPGGLMKQQLSTRGRWNVSLCRESVQRTLDVASVVAAAFIGPKPPGQHVNHIDYDCRNNRADNLEYLTPSENIRHAYAHGFIGGRGERQGQAKLTEHDVALIRRSPLGPTALAAHYNVARATIKKILSGDTWKHL